MEALPKLVGKFRIGGETPQDVVGNDEASAGHGYTSVTVRFVFGSSAPLRPLYRDGEGVVNIRTVSHSPSPSTFRTTLHRWIARPLATGPGLISRSETDRRSLPVHEGRRGCADRSSGAAASAVARAAITSTQVCRCIARYLQPQAMASGFFIVD